MLSDYDKLLVTGRNPIREKQGQVRKPVGRDLIVKMGAKRILVADTGEEFRRSFIETVASEPDIQVLGETGDGQELVQMVKEMAPDLVVMEIVLAQMDGIEVLEELGKLEHRPKVLILSSFAKGSMAELAAANAATNMWSPYMPQTVVHSWLLEDASFLRLSSLTVGYTLPASWTRKVRINKVRLYATGTNLFCWTPYSGFDPEVDTRRATPMTPNVDYSAYPKSRSWVFGANISF